MMIKIGDLDEAKNRAEIATCSPRTAVRAASKYMADWNVGAIPVLDKDGRVVGIFSERDLLKRVAAQNKRVDDTIVEDVMTPNPQTVRLTDDVNDAIQYMIDGGYRHLPVVDEDHQLMGMLSLRDFMALNWRQMLARTGRHSVIAFLKSPQAFAMIIGIVLYVLVMISIL